jgi:lysophospholipase L1-like esterase
MLGKVSRMRIENVARAGLVVSLLSGCSSAGSAQSAPDASASDAGDASSPLDAPSGDHASPEGAPGDASNAGDAQGSTDAGPPDTGPPAVRRIGRFDLSDPAQPSAEWSGSAMEAMFTGTSVAATLGGASNYFAVLVDGTEEPVTVTDGGSSYALAGGLAPGTHHVLVFRRDEAFDQPSALVGFTFGDAGALLPPPATPARRIEVIGDSITAGYGDECTNASQSFSAATENEYLAYGSLTGRAMGADVHVIAWSGKGLYQNLDGTTTETMPILWQRTLPTDATSTWDPSSWIPDAVVVNLGTNDYGAPGADPTTSFTNAYVTFVTQLRAVYPSAHFFLCVGPMLGGTQYTEAQGAIQSVIATRASAGDNALTSVSFPTQDCKSDGSGCGCDYHPSPATHAAMAQVLEAAMKSALGW